MTPDLTDPKVRDELRKRPNSELGRYMAAALDLIEKQQAWMPKTRNGVLLAIAMHVWKPNYIPPHDVVRRTVVELSLDSHGWSVRTLGHGTYRPDELYSSEQAAQAAAKEASNAS